MADECRVVGFNNLSSAICRTAINNKDATRPSDECFETVANIGFFIKGRNALTGLCAAMGLSRPLSELRVTGYYLVE